MKSPKPTYLPSLALWLAVVAVLAASPATAQLPEALDQRLVSTFGPDQWQVETFGPARWLDEGDAYTTLEPGSDEEEQKELVRYETATGRRTVLVSLKDLTPAASAPLEIEDYSWSPDRGRLLIFTNSKKVWRRKTRGDYWVLDLEKRKLSKLGGDSPESSLMFAEFSPDGGSVAYVRANDLYLESLGTGDIRPITTGGSPTRIHGTSDWVYEEELGVRDGYRFSPDGKRIAYWELDSEGVGIFSLIDNTGSLYPEIQEIPYPKVGTTNSAVGVGVVTLDDGKTIHLQLPGKPREHYVARLEWVDDTTLVLQHLNRLQNRNDVLLADARDGSLRRMYRDQNEAWLDVVDRFVWVGSELLWLSERSGWRHAYRLPRDGSAPELVTRFEADVIELVGLDRPEPAESLYFLASPGDATRRYLYSSPLDGSSLPKRVTPKSQIGWHSYDLSPNGAWAFHTFSSFDRAPRVELIRLPSHLSVRALVDNQELQTTLGPQLAPPVDFFTVEIEPGVTLDSWRLLPPSFDPARKYPLLVFVYGEPAGQTVVDRWGGRRGLFHRALAEAGWVVVSFDNRGTPAPKGAAWRKTVYGAIGELSAADQAAAVRALLESSPYLDPGKVAIWGWSGGGSNTLNAMFRYPDVFEVGVSVAPVPDQLLYDTIYQERYMGLPEENEDGYRRGSPIHFAEGLQGRLLLVHGSGDDNVHYQGTERLVNRLVELGKAFDLMVYPNRSHTISEGEGTSLHLHRLIARYLLESDW